MIDDETLALVKPGAWLINVARGRLVDERALMRALRDGPLGGAVLDTFHDEPLPPMSSFYDLPNVIVTPHTAWSSGRVLDRSVELFCDNLRGSPRASRCSTSSTPPRGTDPAGSARPLRFPIMQTAIVGLAGSGKTTVFNTLTRGHAETGGFGGVTLNVGVVKVPDARLDRLAEIFKPKKIVHADVTYVDLPAPPPSSEGHVGTEELPAEHLARLRDSDALLHVVRAFEDPAHPHPEGSVDPARDLERLDLEFILADLTMAERRLERLTTSGRHGTPAEREAAEREEVVVNRLHEGLQAGRPIRDLGLDVDEEKAIRGFRFLIQKPVLVLLNVGEADLASAPAAVARIAAGYDHHDAMVDALSARIEMELGELEPDEAAVFMEELGIAESGLDRVIGLTYRLLGLDLVPDRGARRGPRLAGP